MRPVHPFRCGVKMHSGGSQRALTDTARRVEAPGYSTFLLPDHLDQPLGTLPALAVAAEASTHLCLGTLVLANDFRHPVPLAEDVATLDQTSDGAAVRIDLLAESLHVLAGCFADGPLTCADTFYTVAGLDGQPKPVQRPANSPAASA